MAFTFSLGKARSSSATNPITSASYTVGPTDKVIGILIKGLGATNRAGGAPTWGSYTFTQANSTQKAAASPEASAEAWYLLNPAPGKATITIPNTGAITCFYTIVIAQSNSGGAAAFDGANGSNNTSTNPDPGAVIPSQSGGIGFAITAGGWTTWAPTAQAGTIIANTDDGADGGGEQWTTTLTAGVSNDLNWTFGTSDDWGAVSMYFTDNQINLENYKFVECVSAGVISVTEKIR